MKLEDSIQAGTLEIGYIEQRSVNILCKKLSTECFYSLTFMSICCVEDSVFGGMVIKMKRLWVFKNFVCFLIYF